LNLPRAVVALVTAALLAGCASGSGSKSAAKTGASAAGSSATPGSATPGSATSGSPEVSDSDSDKPTGSASSAGCTGTATARPGVAGQLPAGLPTVAGWIPTEAVSQGQTKAIRGLVRGEVGDLVTVRDAAVNRISAAGYRKTDSDQEPGYEAEADFTGPQEGNINVRACGRDYLVVTYTIRQ
jgi:hypothetical protein